MSNPIYIEGEGRNCGDLLAKFKAGDHVWAKQPKELAGRTGEVKAVDAYHRMYDVAYGNEMWRIREDDLEFVSSSAENFQDPVYEPESEERPTGSYYKTTEDYIRNCTRQCSNKLSGFDEPTFHPWLTPDHARSVVIIAKENIIEKAVEWMEKVMRPKVKDALAGNYFNESMKQFRKAMEEAEV